jgi:nucleoside-diphosphate-sugar epimerase
MVVLKLMGASARIKTAILTHNRDMNRLLIIGSGDIARRTIPQLTGRYEVFALLRNPAQAGKIRALGATPVIGDLDKRDTLQRLAGLADVVLHLAPPKSPEKKHKHSHAAANLGQPASKVASEFSDRRTRNLLAALSRGFLPRKFVYISTSGVYGDCSGARVSETHPLNPKSERARRRADAESQIRKWAGRNGVCASILRVPGIYAVDRLPLERIRASLPCIVAEEDSYTNHIHADDLASIIIATMHSGKPNRVYHASDDSEIKMGDYMDTVADAYRLRRLPRITRAKAQIILPDELLSFMNESRRLTNNRLKRELKVKLRYPTIMDFLATSH